MILKYKHKYDNHEIEALKYEGANSIDEVETFTHLRAHDIYMIDPKDKNAVTCVVSTPIGVGCYTPTVLTPGMYLARLTDGTLKSFVPCIFESIYEEIKDKEE